MVIPVQFDRPEVNQAEQRGYGLVLFGILSKGRRRSACSALSSRRKQATDWVSWEICDVMWVSIKLFSAYWNWIVLRQTSLWASVTCVLVRVQAALVLLGDWLVLINCWINNSSCHLSNLNLKCCHFYFKENILMFLCLNVMHLWLRDVVFTNLSFLCCYFLLNFTVMRIVEI